MAEKASQAVAGIRFLNGMDPAQLTETFGRHSHETEVYYRITMK